MLRQKQMVMHGQKLPMWREALTPRSPWRGALAGGLRACWHLVVCRPAWRRRKRWRSQSQVQCSIDWKLQEVRDWDLIPALASEGLNSEIPLFRKDCGSGWDEHTLYSTSSWQATMLKEYNNPGMRNQRSNWESHPRCHLWPLILLSFILFKCPVWDTWVWGERGAENLTFQWA